MNASSAPRPAFAARISDVVTIVGEDTGNCVCVHDDTNLFGQRQQVWAHNDGSEIVIRWPKADDK